MFINTNVRQLKCFIVGLLSLPQIAAAQVFSSANLSLRTFPLGVVAELEGGYRIPLWAHSDRIFAGTAGLALGGATAGVWNLGQVRFELAPTRFFKIVAQELVERSATEPRGLDCQMLACLSPVRRQSIEFTLDAAHQRFFGRLQYLMANFLTEAGTVSPDLVYYIPAQDRGRLRALTFFLGYKWIEEVSWLLHFSQAATENVDLAYRHFFLGPFYSHSGRSAFLGLGQVKSVLVGENLSLLIRYGLEF